jgi:hypothetical protein
LDGGLSGGGLEVSQQASFGLMRLVGKGTD